MGQGSRPLCGSRQTVGNPKLTHRLTLFAEDSVVGWLEPFDDQVDSVSAVIARGKRPVTFRTRKLSLSAPMVLQGGPCGRVGRRRTSFQWKAPDGWSITLHRSGAFLRSPAEPSREAPRLDGSAWILHWGSRRRPQFGARRSSQRRGGRQLGMF